MNEEFIVFKNKQGEVVSVATKTDTQDKGSETSITMHGPADVTAEVVSKTEFQLENSNQLLPILEKSVGIDV